MHVTSSPSCQIICKMPNLLSADHKERLLAICKEHGGELVDCYREGRKITLRCEHGHIWHPALSNVLNGSWCGHPECVAARIARSRAPIKERMESQLREAIKAQGGTWVSGDYVNKTTKIEVKCGKGHKWMAIPDAIKSGAWCPRCVGKLPKSEMMAELHKVAASRGGSCLAKDYVNNSTKVRWRCSEGHEWDASPRDVKSRTWCPQCAGKKKGTIDEVSALAKERGGKCLSSEYKNRNSKLLWECSEGHHWKATAGSVVSGSWCQHCAGNAKGTIEEMRTIAEERGGKCLSSKYRNKSSKLLWECDKGHRWAATSGNVKSNGSWCPKCFGSEKLGIERMREIAESRGGECLSTEYVSTKSKLRFSCAFGHKWETKPAVLMKGSWCPKCSEGLGERICRAFFEQLFEVKFPKLRPSWLVGEHGAFLELDGYCEELGLAFEHQGKQHYSRRFNSASGLSDIRRRDEIKRALCKEHGVTLIEIPEIPDITPIAELKDTIRRECKQTGYELPTLFENTEVDFSPAYKTNHDMDQMNKLREIAREHNGELLATNYLGSKSPHRWRCRKGHEWEAKPNNIKNGSWCPTCAGKAKVTIEDMRKLARSHGGRCLSKRYVNIMTPLLWECQCGHKWESAPNNVKNAGSWCPECGRSKRGETRRRNQQQGSA